jgi:hypothetical protein
MAIVFLDEDPEPEGNETPQTYSDATPATFSLANPKPSRISPPPLLIRENESTSDHFAEDPIPIPRKDRKEHRQASFQNPRIVAMPSLNNITVKSSWESPGK